MGLLHLRNIIILLGLHKLVAKQRSRGNIIPVPSIEVVIIGNGRRTPSDLQRHSIIIILVSHPGLALGERGSLLVVALVILNQLSPKARFRNVLVN